MDFLLLLGGGDLLLVCHGVDWEADGVLTWDSEPRRFTLDLDYE